MNYIRKYEEKPVIINRKELSFKEFTYTGIDRKVTTIASTLSGKPNIYGTELNERFKQIKRLRSSIQHWDVERRKDYFIELPDNHPLKTFPNLEPTELAQSARAILDNYALA